MAAESSKVERVIATLHSAADAKVCRPAHTHTSDPFGSFVVCGCPCKCVWLPVFGLARPGSRRAPVTPSVGCVGQVASLVDGSWDENSKRLQAAVAAVQSQTLAKVRTGCCLRVMRGAFDEGRWGEGRR